MTTTTHPADAGEQLADLAAAPSTGAFLAALAPYTDRVLVFEYAGRQIQPGYHVTEVTAATFASMDCGGRPDAWQETIVQLWDVPGDAGAAHMTVGKFLGIYGKVAAAVPVSEEATLTVEWGDDAGPALRHRPLRLRVAGDAAVVVEVGAVQATCKPRYDADGADRPVLVASGGGLPVASTEPSGGGCCTPAAPSVGGGGG
jgi:hypothetical protein